MILVTKKYVLFSLIFLSSLFRSQVIKDTILGKPKFVKESVVFLNNSGPFTFMEGDSEYGHAVIMIPEFLRKRMKNTWFETDFCRYINNETLYDRNRNIVKEIWYYRSGKMVDDYTYTYDHLNRLIIKKTKNDYSDDTDYYFYQKDNRNALFKESYYKFEDKPVEKNIINFESLKPLLVTKFDTVTRTDSTFAVTNNIWKKIDKRSYTQVRDTVYHRKLSSIKVYNNQYKIIEEKKFNYTDDYQNKKITLSRHFKYEYDVLGNLAKQINLEKGEVSSYTVYLYTKDQKLKRKTVYYKNKIWHDITFEYRGNYIARLFYLDKMGDDDREVVTKVISFKYKFDKEKNWTEIIKNIDGKDLYKWVRKIEYY